MVDKKEEIVWDVDWDELVPESPAVPSPPMDSRIETTPTASDPAVSPPPAQGATIIPKTPQGEPVVQAQPAQPATIPLPAPLTPPPPPLPPAPTTVVPAPLPIDPGDRAQPGQQAGKKLVRGERFDLGSICAKNPQISIELISSNPAAVKLICLGLDAAEIVAGTAYCVGPRQPSSPCGGITHAARAEGGQEILVRASILPTNIKRLEVSVVTSDYAANLGNTVEGIRLWAGDVVVAESRHLDPACASSSCATLVEIYERQGTWRMRVIGEVLASSVNELLAKHGAKTN